eukprot:jgi/Hompol1/5525/HPOL_001291-RA
MLKPTDASGDSKDDPNSGGQDAVVEEGDGGGDVPAAKERKGSLPTMEAELESAQENDAIIFQELQGTLDLLSAPGDSEQEQVVARLRGEYDKLHRIFLGSRKNEKSLIKKCRELTAELSANASKVQAALKLSQNDRSTIASLRKEVKKAWKMVEAASDKESRAKDLAASLKSEIEALRGAMAEQGVAPTASTPAVPQFARNKLLELQIEQEDQLRKTIKDKQGVEQELANTSSELRAAKIENEELNEKLASLINERGLMDEEMLTLKDLLASKKAEQDRDIRSRGKIEQTLKQTMEAWEKRESEMKVKAGETKNLRDHVSKLEMQLANERVRLEKFEKDREQLTTRLTRLQQDYDDQSVQVQRLLNENHEQGRDLKTWEEEISRLKENFKMITRAKDALTKKLKMVDEAKLGAEMERDSLRSNNSHLTHDIDVFNKELEQTKKQLEMASRERDIAQKNFVKATGATQKQFNVLKLAEQTQRKLEQEIQGYKDEAQKMRKAKKDRDNKINEASRLDQIVMTKDEDMKMKDMIIFDSKKKIVEFERKLKEQQALYENVRADRNVYSKNLIESQDEITEMKRKLKIMNHQVEQLKEEIASKEAVLVKEHFEHSKLEKEKEALSIQIGKLLQQYEESQQMIQNQQAEENKLRHIITEADAERLRQKKEYDAVVQERDILGTQLIRRNDELSLLYEKIKIQTSTLNKGEIQYRERLEDIRVLRLEIKRLRREKAILQTETQNVDSLRNEIFRLQRDVLRERTRVKMKILTTALFSVILLNKSISLLKWASLAILTVGIGIVQLSGKKLDSADQASSNMDRFLGLIAVTIACLLSGLAGVWFEKVLKGTKASLFLRNVQLGLFSVVSGMIFGVYMVDGAAVAENGFFQGYTFWTWSAILCQAVGGLIVAIVVKYADNILKGFATSIAIIVASVASVFIFNFEITTTFVVGASMVLYAYAKLEAGTK